MNGTPVMGKREATDGGRRAGDIVRTTQGGNRVPKGGTRRKSLENHPGASLGTSRAREVPVLAVGIMVRSKIRRLDTHDCKAEEDLTQAEIRFQTSLRPSQWVPTCQNCIQERPVDKIRRTLAIPCMVLVALPPALPTNRILLIPRRRRPAWPAGCQPSLQHGEMKRLEHQCEELQGE